MGGSKEAEIDSAATDIYILYILTWPNWVWAWSCPTMESANLCHCRFWLLFHFSSSDL